MSQLELLGVAALVFLALLVLLLVVFAPLLGGVQRRRRLAQIDDYGLNLGADKPQPRKTNPLTRAGLAVSAAILSAGGLERRFATQLDRAGMAWRPAEWVLLRLSVAVGLGVLLALPMRVVGLVLGFVMGWLATALYHRRRARQRVEKFAALLPEALQLVIGSLRSGFSLPQALEAMAKEVPAPISAEFNRMLAQVRLGLDLETALERLARRVANRDLGWTVMAIRVQREVGGNLAEVLATTVNTIRERENLRGHVRSLTAEGRLSALVLLSLPILVGGLMVAVNRDYISPLWTDPRGVMLLVIGVGLVALGAFWLSRLVRVEI
ncbi:type II secretion system F family protein [Phytohabitans aurantiacus]|uniref:Secretion system protein n=1 Tax=Phytohabitans aurantiacus TaxID=3016789 RepID=A0ABQ5QN51_9ACTN|nr:type II secretion system F family protein [Phytohabitans aurantiacus]GLH95189.1 secretion system protein [Phytohabitans aurantiacus]